MTPQQLCKEVATRYGLNSKWPKTYEVDAETYALCCQAVFDDLSVGEAVYVTNSITVYKISLGNVKSGLMFKGMELILKP